MSRLAQTRVLPLAVLALSCVALTTTVAPAAAAGKNGRALQIEALRVATKAGPLYLRVKARPELKLRVWVNGKPVKRGFEFAHRRAKEVELRRGDGLRPGANRLLIRAGHGSDGPTVRRTVRLSSLDLLADAGEDRGATRRARAQVGVARPPAAVPGGEVKYRWRVVAKPRGAKASLRQSRDARAVLRAKRHGTYLLQLEADPPGPGPVSYDQVAVTVAPEDPPIGVPINTLGNGNAIVIGGKQYGGFSGRGKTSYVVLNRVTREPVLDAQGREVSGTVLNDANGVGQLLGLARAYGDGANFMNYLMIIGGDAMPVAQQDAFGRLAKKLGAPIPSEEDFRALSSSEYSIVGIPGAPEGAATIRIPNLDPKGSIVGSIIGYLQKLQTVNIYGVPVYTYVSPEYPNFDTSRERSATRNVMVVGPQVYDGSLPAGATAGFQITTVEPFTFRGVISMTIATNTANASIPSDRKLQGEAAATLKSVLSYPGKPLIFVQTIGKPKAAGPEWGGVVDQLARLGANRVLVNALGGSSEYALVGHLDSNKPATEASTAYDHGPYGDPAYPAARLVGSLARARNYRFEPTVSSTPTSANPGGMVNLDLIALAYQDSRPFPVLGADANPPAAPAEGAAAAMYICKALDFCQPANSCPEIRACYWQRFGATVWTSKQTDLNALAYPADGTKEKLGFSKPTFEAVRAQIGVEIRALIVSKGYLEGLQEPFEKQQAQSFVDLNAISQKIWDSLQRPKGSSSTAWVLGLVGKVFAVGGFAGPPLSGVAAGFSAIFGLASYLSTETGQPILGSEVKAEAGVLGAKLIERINLARQASYGIAKLVASDYGKLTDLARHANTDWALPENPEAVATPLRVAARQWFYEALVPVAYPYLIRGNSNARNMNCRPYVPGWQSQPDSAQMWVTIGYDDNGNPIKNMFFFARGLGSKASPPDSLAQELFKPRREGGLGMEKFSFFTPQVFNGRVHHAVNTALMCELGNVPDAR